MTISERRTRDKLIVESVKLKMERIIAQAAVDPSSIELSTRSDWLLEQTIIQLTRRVCYLPTESWLTIPADWWQAFKERWFFKWMLRRWPVVYKTYEARAYFPQMVFPPQAGPPEFHFHKWTPE
jgi:hypothetical protein